MDDISYKISFVGGTGAGKTALINRIVNNFFDPAQTVTSCAIPHFKKLIVGNRNINLNYLDMPGIDKYRSINRFYYKDSDIIILVYNVTYRQSFDEIMNYHYENSKNLVENASNIFLLNVV